MSASERTESPLFRKLATWVVRLRWPLLAVNLALTGYLGAQLPRLMTDTSVKAFMISQSEAARIQERLEDTFGLDTPFMLIVEGDVFSLPYLQRLKRFHDELAAIDMDLTSLGKRDLRDESGKILVRARDREDPPKAVAKSVPAGMNDDFDSFGSDDEGWGDEAGGSIVDEIVSLINVRDTRMVDDGLRVEGLFEDWPPSAETIQAKKALALSRKSMVGQVVDERGRYSVIFVRTDFMDSDDMERVDAEVRRIGAKYDGEGFRVRYSGVPAFAAELNRILIHDVGITNALSFVLMFVLLSWIFRHPLGVVGPMLVVAQATVWMVGTMVMLGTPMTALSTILPSFVICVGIGDSVHMLSVYRQIKATGVDNREAIIRTIAQTGRPVVFTTLTTCTGLLSFRFASLDAIRDLGLFGACGVFYALVASLIFLPTLLTFAPRGRFGLRDPQAGGNRIATRILQLCNGLSRPRADGSQAPRNRVLWTGVALTVVSIAGIALVRVHHNPLLWFPKDAPARQAVEILDEAVGGSSDVSLLLQAKPGKDLRDQDAMARVAELERYILAYPPLQSGETLVRHSTGLIDVLRESWWALNGQTPEQYRLPDEQRALVDVFTMFESASPDRLRRLMTLDAQMGLMLVRLKWVEGSLYTKFGEYLNAGIDRIIGDRIDVYPTGTVYQSIQSDNAVLADLVRSFSIALVVITVLMMGVLGDFKLGLVAMVPNLTPIGIVLAFMGATNIGVDMSNLLIASIGIGIAVDDTIHYLHHFKSHYAAHGDREAAIEHAFHRAGNAMISTSVILLAGFLIFTGASLTNLVVFGLLIAITVLAALLVDLIFTPALLRLTFAAKRA